MRPSARMRDVLDMWLFGVQEGEWMKLCLDCKHCYLSAGYRGYSELTPGEPITFRCDKGHWEFEEYLEDKGKLKSKLLMAETCKDHEVENWGKGNPCPF
jgi:hypothetical protein